MAKSSEQLAEYLVYALTILKNIDLPCAGVTTPGGFGNRVLPQLAEATFTACREVFDADVPHYFRHLYDQGDQSVAPRVERAKNVSPSTPSPWSVDAAAPTVSNTDARPECVVSVIGCTGDWTGGWDCSDRGDAGSLHQVPTCPPAG